MTPERRESYDDETQNENGQRKTLERAMQPGCRFMNKGNSWCKK